jgi:hypothetical protein
MPVHDGDGDGSIGDKPPLRREYLKYDDRSAIDRKIVARVAALGETPTRPMPPDWDVESGDYPHPRNRWVFPSVAYSRGGDYARDFEQAMHEAMQRGDVKNLRLVTLRFGDRKPEHGGLLRHLKSLSAAVNNTISYLVRNGVARPQLSAVHIRLDPLTGRLDPHLHGIWDIAPETIKRVTELLEKRFSGVWIEQDTIVDLSKIAFYVATGIVPHSEVPSWPLAALGAVWRLPARQHYVRPAGFYAAWIRRRNADRNARQPAHRVPDDATRGPANDAPQPPGFNPSVGADDHQGEEAGRQEPALGREGDDDQTPGNTSSSSASSPAKENQSGLRDNETPKESKYPPETVTQFIEMMLSEDERVADERARLHTRVLSNFDVVFALLLELALIERSRS